MVSESLKLTFNMLTVYFNELIEQPSFRLGNVFSELMCIFLENDKIDLRDFFFSYLGENTIYYNLHGNTAPDL